jgi:hypothetical protein
MMDNLPLIRIHHANGQDHIDIKKMDLRPDGSRYYDRTDVVTNEKLQDIFKENVNMIQYDGNRHIVYRIKVFVADNATIFTPQVIAIPLDNNEDKFYYLQDGNIFGAINSEKHILQSTQAAARESASTFYLSDKTARTVTLKMVEGGAETILTITDDHHVFYLNDNLKLVLMGKTKAGETGLSISYF